MFLSFAFQDAEAAWQIAIALRGGGLEVWFDQSDLRGGDAWAHQIRAPIHDCWRFLPMLSAHTEARFEGYVGREWKLGVDRTYDLSERSAFLVPIVIDELRAPLPNTSLLSRISPCRVRCIE